MEHMESKMQQQYEQFEAKMESLDPFIDDLIGIAKKHNIDNSDLKLVAEMFDRGYIPAIESFNT